MERIENESELFTTDFADGADKRALISVIQGIRGLVFAVLARFAPRGLNMRAHKETKITKETFAYKKRGILSVGWSGRILLWILYTFAASSFRIVRLVCPLNRHAGPNPKGHGINVNANLNQVKNWPELAQQANWSAVHLAKRCGVSESTLRRHFHRVMGKSPKKWLAEERQNQAKLLFKEHHSTKEAATVLHYSHPSDLSRAYRQRWGIAPKTEMPNENAKMRKCFVFGWKCFIFVLAICGRPMRE